MFKKTPLMKEIPGIFSPIHVNADILRSDKSAALYKFSAVFFPNLGPSVLKLLLDMEKNSHRMIAALGLKEKEGLIRELEGITVEIRYTVKDKGEEMLALPVNISPAEVLKNASLVKPGSRYNKKVQEEINGILVSFIAKEIQRKVQVITEDFLKGMLGKPKIPDMLKELLSRGIINRDGSLAEGTTIKDLVSGKYAKLFRKVAPQELINESLLIRETINACYDWEGEDYRSLANEALRERGILEITLGEMTKREQKQRQG